MSLKSLKSSLIKLYFFFLHFVCFNNNDNINNSEILSIIIDDVGYQVLEHLESEKKKEVRLSEN